MKKFSPQGVAGGEQLHWEKLGRAALCRGYGPDISRGLVTVPLLEPLEASGDAGKVLCIARHKGHIVFKGSRGNQEVGVGETGACGFQFRLDEAEAHHDGPVGGAFVENVHEALDAVAFGFRIAGFRGPVGQFADAHRGEGATRKEKGKTVSVALSKEQYEAMKQASENWKAAKAILREMEILSRREIFTNLPGVKRQIPPSDKTLGLI